MFRKLSALVAGVLLCAIASSQSVPNGGTITSGQVWTTSQWINAWQSKFDVTGGSLTAPTINNPAITGGTQSAPAISSPAISGAATVAGTLAISGASSLTLAGSVVPAVNQSPTWTGNHTFTPASGTAVQINGFAGVNTSALVVSGANFSGARGMTVQGGTSASDFNSVFQNATASTNLALLYGDGGLVLGSATSGDQGLGSLNAQSIFKNGSIVPAVNQSPTITGNWTFTPASGTGVTVNSAVNTNAIAGSDGNTSWAIQTDSTPRSYIGTLNATQFGITTNNSTRMIFSAGGNVTIGPPSSGTPLTVNGGNGSNVLALGSTASASTLISGYQNVLAGAWSLSSQSTDGMAVGSDGAASLQLFTNSSTRFTVSAAGGLFAVGATGGDKGLGTINMAGCFVNGVACASAGAAAAGSLTGSTLASGVTASSLTSVGTLGSLAVSGTITTGGLQVGYLNVPQNAQSTSYTATFADSGKQITSVTASPVTFTIPANVSVAYTVGTVLTFTTGPGTGTVTIGIGGSDTLTLAGTNSTGSRSLAPNSVATAIKVGSTNWNISGAGIT